MLATVMDTYGGEMVMETTMVCGYDGHYNITGDSSSPGTNIWT